MVDAPAKAAERPHRAPGFSPGSRSFWLPAAAFLLVAAVLAPLDIRTVWEPPLLFPLLNGIVFVGVSMVVAVLAAQAFEKGGSVTLLLLGAGTLAFGIASISGPLFISLGDVDAGVASHNSISLLAASVHAVSAILVWNAVAVTRRRLALLASTYGLVLFTAATIALLAAGDRLPPFMTASGGTSVRIAVLASATVLYLASATAFNVRAHRTGASFLHWYAMGLALIGIGLATVALGLVSTPIGWTGRLAQVTGQIYILMCLMETFRESPAPAAEAISHSFGQAEQALRALETRYLTLFNAVSDSVVVHRLASDDSPGAFIDFNEAFVALLGYKQAELARIEPDSLIDTDRQRFSTAKNLHAEVTALYETRLTRRDGTTVPVEIHTRMLDPDSGIALSVIRDVSEREAAELKREMELVRLRQLLDEATMGFVLVDDRGRIVVMNKAVERLWGRPLALANSPSEYWMYPAVHHGTDHPIAADEWPASKVLAGAESAEVLADITLPDGEVVTARFRATPVSTMARGLGNVLVSAEEVTEEVERERLSRELDTIRTLVTSTFEAGDIQRRITYMGADALKCDGALLLMRGEGSWITAVGFGGLTELSEGVQRAESSPMDVAVSSRRAVPCPGPGCTVLDLPALLLQRGFHSAIFVPIIAQGQPVGMSVYAWQADREPLKHRVEFANRLLGVAALALDNSEAYQRERLIADTLQQVIISVPTEIHGLEWSHLYRPASAEANVGGDFYDVFETDNGDIGVIVGDVSGKGVAAAKLTSLLRDGARAYAILDEDPGVVLTRLNHLVYRHSTAETFATLFYGVLSRRSGELRYGSAGHVPAILSRRGCESELLQPWDPICGAFSDAVYTTGTRQLQAGDKIVLYTDGVTEARRNHELFGERRLAQVVDSLCDNDVADIPEDLLATVEAFSDGNLSDDVVIVCLSLVEEPDQGHNAA